MFSEPASKIHVAVSPVTGGDVAAILREHGWLKTETEEVASWTAEAAALLGPRVPSCEAISHLLALVFEYDARAVLGSREAQEVLARASTRGVLRVLAREILSGGPVDSNRLKEIVSTIKASCACSSREIFHPLRMALTGRVGEGELDRVVLLVDRAARIEGLAPVKSVRTRVLEFCAALDGTGEP